MSRAAVDAGYYAELLRPVFAGRRWLIAYDVLAGATDLAARLHAYGAERSLAIAGARGTGAIPDLAHTEAHVLGTSGPTIMATIRAFEAAFEALPAEVVARVAAWDPSGRARAIGTMFATGEAVAGRRYYGVVPPAWRRLEDKTVVDAIWDACGVARAPSAVVAAAPAALASAAARLERGAGTAWVGDNKEGFHGGAEYLRWVRTPADAAAAVAFLGAHCERVRVMPFLEGIPCSVHGLVLGGEVIALRPVEMVVLRVPGAEVLQYASAASFWDPPEAQREAMRAAARAVGAYLHRTVGYRGAFTIDGVVTREGFRPTELNARYGAALAVLTGGIAELPLYLLHLAAVEGEALDFHPAALEALILAHADARRQGGGAVTVARPPPGEGARVDVVFEADRCREASAGEPVDGRLEYGPGPVGGYVRLTLDPDRTPAGPSVAPRVVAGLALADRAWGTGIGPLVPAPDVWAG